MRPDDHALLLALAPENLAIFRTKRYDGTGFDVSLSEFAEQDQELIRAVYTPLRQLYELWLYMRDAPQPQLLADAVLRLTPPELLATARQLGEATRAHGELSVPLRRTLHDIRGGALAVLFTHVRLISDGDAEPGDLQAAVWMARDHAKMMRNAIFDLDPHVRAADEGDKIHPVDDFVRKWSGSSAELAGRRVKVQVNSRFDGAIANRCLETSALDRVLYNYLNNALRFAADETVLLDILPVGGGLVRWVVRNRLSDSQIDWLQEFCGNDPRRLYRGGLTREGNGIGLNTCADILAACFGLASGEEAVDEGYLGAQLDGDLYAAWFHWPSAEESA